MNEVKVQRNYKDSIFRMLFKDKEKNPNMPLRDLLYATSILQKRTSTENLYGSKQIKIPNPRFVVLCVQDAQGICDVCGTGKKLCEKDAPGGSGGESGELLHRGGYFIGVPKKESCGGYYAEYI